MPGWLTSSQLPCVWMPRETTRKRAVRTLQHTRKTALRAQRPTWPTHRRHRCRINLHRQVTNERQSTPPSPLYGNVKLPASYGRPANGPVNIHEDSDVAQSLCRGGAAAYTLHRKRSTEKKTPSQVEAFKTGGMEGVSGKR